MIPEEVEQKNMTIRLVVMVLAIAPTDAAVERLCSRRRVVALDGHPHVAEAHAEEEVALSLDAECLQQYPPPLR